MTQSSLVAVVIATLLCGCATLAPPKPWEKGTLAQRDMQFDSDRLGAKLDDHVYASKEAVSGGLGVGGGGCGCN
jgi:hypothetical protein